MKRKSTAPKSERRKGAGKKPIEQYEHKDKKRANIPPVGLVTPDTDPIAASPSARPPARQYQYDPHLDPQLVWAGKAERTSFEIPTGMYRLLLLSCSQRKRATPGQIPALQRYDGPAYQVVRRYLRKIDDPLLHICVLSAQYGLIASDDPIAFYDRKMDAERAAELRESSLATLKTKLGQQRYSEVFVCTSRTYLSAVRGMEKLHRKVTFGAPGQGKKLASLWRWLRGEPSGR